MASIPLPNGAQVALGKTFEAAKVITATSNASPAVATSATNGYANGDLLLINMPSWSRVDGAIVRASAVAAGTFAMENVNSLDTGRYPPLGAGSARKVSAWTPLPKIPTFETTGGDPKSQTSGYLDYEKDFEFFTGTNPERLNFTISYAPGSPAYDDLVKASDSGEAQVIRLTLKDGTALFYSGQLFFNKSPTTTKDQEMVNNVSLAMQSETVRYAKFV